MEVKLVEIFRLKMQRKTMPVKMGTGLCMWQDSDTCRTERSLRIGEWIRVDKVKIVKPYI